MYECIIKHMYVRKYINMQIIMHMHIIQYTVVNIILFNLLIGSFLWHRIWPSACRAVCYLRSKKTNGRILLCGALAFLWDKEGVSDEEIEK